MKQNSCLFASLEAPPPLISDEKHKGTTIMYIKLRNLDIQYDIEIFVAMFLSIFKYLFIVTKTHVNIKNNFELS